jgi:hypothetical protein
MARRRASSGRHAIDEVPMSVHGVCRRESPRSSHDSKASSYKKKGPGFFSLDIGK